MEANDEQLQSGYWRIIVFFYTLIFNRKVKFKRLVYIYNHCKQKYDREKKHSLGYRRLFR